MYKAADLVLSLPPGHPAWPTQMFEPLTIAFVFPFLSFRPWQLRGSIALLALGRKLSQVWKDNHTREGPFLRQLWNFQRSISSLPSGLAWKVLQSEDLDRLSNCKARKRRGNAVEKTEGQQSVRHRKKRRYD